MRFLPLALLWLVPAAALAQDDGSAPVTPGPATPTEATADDAMTLRRPVALEIASAYGFDNWKQIEQLEFTFNVERGDNTTRRQWTWRPAEGSVTLRRGDDQPISFQVIPGGITLPADADHAEEIVTANRQFVNDSYWFLFPFQIVWSNPTVTDHGPAPLPIGEGQARKVTVQYPRVGGYTPGDAYDLFLGDDDRIVQWVHRRGGGEKGGPMTWRNHRALGPIVVCLDHWSPDRSSHVFFSDVRATVRDDDGQAATHQPTPLKEN